MKRLALCCALLLGGCSGFAERVCESETTIRGAVTTATGYGGPIGDVLGTIIGFGLELLCGTVDVTATAVDSTGDGVGSLLGLSSPQEDPEP